ncbi:MAG: M28 family peptidase [bacterium]
MSRFPEPSRRRDLLLAAAGGLLLLFTAVAPADAVQQPPSRQDPDVAVQKEWIPPDSLVRGALALPWLTRAELRKTLADLAAPEMEGRLTGTGGYERAARYAARKMQEADLRPGGEDGTYFQPFVVEANEIIGSVSLEVRGRDWTAPSYTPGVDFVARGFSGSGEVESAEVVFLGYGLSEPGLGWDDYEGVEPRGKVGLVYMGAPPVEAEWGEKTRPRYKATTAKQHGLRALVFIDDPGPGVPHPIVSVYHGQEGRHQPDLPQLSVTYGVADDLMRGTPFTARNLRRQMTDTGAPYSMGLPTRVSLEIHARYTPRAQTWNVVGFVEGSDPSLAADYIVVGGHLDHVGQQVDLLLPGAQDNASGSTLVLEMARALAAAPIKPARSVCFVLFAGEELFLLGSEYFAAHPPRSSDSMAGMINLDMAGTGPQLRMAGGATTPAFHQFAVDADRLYGGFGLAESEPRPIAPGASDHSAFVNAGVPTLYFASGGAPGRAHTSSDTVGTIDFDAMERTARVVYLVLYQMADRR